MPAIKDHGESTICGVCGELTAPGDCTCPGGPTELCTLCGSYFRLKDELAEMHDPETLDSASGRLSYSESTHGIVHAQCGLDHGWELS